jgi:light-regulated signal transduction histidine kinase (bacteriophytochrome)
MNAELEERVKVRTSQLEAANQEWEAFSYSVSHDLRAPLRHIDGCAELLRQNPGLNLDDEDKQHLNIVTTSAKRMSKLIDDLLHFSRMGRRELRRQECDPNTMIAEVLQEMSLNSENRKIEWKIEALPKVSADPSLLKQVWANLLSNAVKYTSRRDRAEIAIGCKIDGDQFEFFIQDNGAGFDMRYADKLFGVFQRLHTSKEFEGTGIGLAHVRRIVLRHGGFTWAEGKVDEGATFYFTLPRATKSELRPVASPHSN